MSCRPCHDRCLYCIDTEIFATIGQAAGNRPPSESERFWVEIQHATSPQYSAVSAMTGVVAAGLRLAVCGVE